MYKTIMDHTNVHINDDGKAKSNKEYKFTAIIADFYPANDYIKGKSINICLS